MKAPEEMKTSELFDEIQRNAEIQKRNPFDSQESMEARDRNRPLFVEMSTRADAPAVP